MRKVIPTLLLVTLFAVPAFAQGPVCNEERARGIARSLLGQCLAAVSGPNFEVEIDVICECPEFGTSVNAIARVRCNPNEECPPFGFLIGSVQLDCDYNVISATCF